MQPDGKAEIKIICRYKGRFKNPRLHLLQKKEDKKVLIQKGPNVDII